MMTSSVWIACIGAWTLMISLADADRLHPPPWWAVRLCYAPLVIALLYLYGYVIPSGCRSGWA